MGRRRERLRGALRGAIPVVVALAALSLTPGQASAAPTSAATTSVTPLLDCAAKNSDGSITVVMGYTSTYASTTAIPLGSRNYVSPSRYDGAQPATFQSGTHHGAFSVTVSTVDNIGFTWHIDGSALTYTGKEPTSSSCPTPTQLPAEGNDTGAGIALLVAGALGVLVVVRMRRRAQAAVNAAATEQPATPVRTEEPADA